MKKSTLIKGLIGAAVGVGGLVTGLLMSRADQKAYFDNIDEIDGEILDEETLEDNVEG